MVLEIKVQHKYNKDPLLQVRKCDLAGGMIFFLHIFLLLGNYGLHLTLFNISSGCEKIVVE